MHRLKPTKTKANEQVEKNCNIILTIIEKTPKVGAQDIYKIAKHHKEFSLTHERYVCKYMTGLTKRGYVKKLGVYRPVYIRDGVKKFKYPIGEQFLQW